MGFTYSGTDFGTCYLKEMEGMYFPSIGTIVSAFIVAGRKPQSTPVISIAPTTTPKGSSFNCGAVGTDDGSLTRYTDKSGVEYQVACKHEVGGAELAAASAPTFGDCFDLCDKMPGCAGFAWLQDDGPGTCYFKPSFNDLSTIGSSPADVAIMVGGRTSPGGPGSSPTTDSATQPTLKPTDSPAGAGCSTLDNSQYPEYAVECQTDRRGGDLLAAASRSFQQCFGICDETEDCIGFSYVGGTGPGICYLKNRLEMPSSSGHVDTAYKRSGGQQPSPASTTVRTTTTLAQPQATTRTKTTKIETTKTETTQTETNKTKTTNTKATKTKTTDTKTTEPKTTKTRDPAPASTAFPQCWRTCIDQNNASSPDQLCDNQDVDMCVHKTCSHADEVAYKEWRDDHCGSTSEPTTMATRTRDKRAAVTMV